MVQRHENHAGGMTADTSASSELPEPSKFVRDTILCVSLI